MHGEKIQEYAGYGEFAAFAGEKRNLDEAPINKWSQGNFGDSRRAN
jgi:hypothetical protein